jgi:pimeloyl-ACP methyl ester carboxylesterase
VERARRTAAAIPGARFEVVPRAGHLLTLERPHEVNRLLDAFLAGVATP